jgi:hypothetical protein
MKIAPGVHFLASAAVSMLAVLNLFGQESVLLTGNPSFRWPNSTIDIPRANAIAAEKVVSFINALAKQLDRPSITVQEFRFARLEEGKIHLVATIDSSGRGFYYALAVISPEGAKFRYTTLTSVSPHVLGGEVVDLDGDGRDEIIAKNFIAGYRGAQSDQIYWYSIYQWHNAVPQDVSASFQQFYDRGALPQLTYLEHWLDLIAHGDHPEEVRLQKAQIEAVRLKYRRKIIGEKNAGIEEAKAWIESGNLDFQKLGIEALVEIPDPKADEALRKLAGSSNPGVARMAQYALQQKAHPRP